MPTWPRNSHKWPLVFARFIMQEKPTVIFPVGEGLLEVPGTWSHKSDLAWLKRWRLACAHADFLKVILQIGACMTKHTLSSLFILSRELTGIIHLIHAGSLCLMATAGSNTWSALPCNAPVTYMYVFHKHSTHITFICSFCGAIPTTAYGIIANYHLEQLLLTHIYLSRSWNLCL